jgi:hypothetical protein
VIKESKQFLTRKQARLVGVSGFAAAALLPVVLWYQSIDAIATDFRWETGYLTGWTGYGLILAGLLFGLPVVLSIGRTPASRLYPRSRNAYAAWGITLYLLGIALASQVAAVTSVHPTY